MTKGSEGDGLMVIAGYFVARSFLGVSSFG
jgi:hypothetical protein